MAQVCFSVDHLVKKNKKRQEEGSMSSACESVASKPIALLSSLERRVDCAVVWVGDPPKRFPKVPICLVAGDETQPPDLACIPFWDKQGRCSLWNMKVTPPRLSFVSPVDLLRIPKAKRTAVSARDDLALVLSTFESKKGSSVVEQWIDGLAHVPPGCDVVLVSANLSLAPTPAELKQLEAKIPAGHKATLLFRVPCGACLSNAQASATKVARTIKFSNAFYDAQHLPCFASSPLLSPIEFRSHRTGRFSPQSEFQLAGWKREAIALEPHGQCLLMRCASNDDNLF